MNRISELEEKVENLERTSFVITEDMPYMPMIEWVHPIYEFTEEDNWKFKEWDLTDSLFTTITDTDIERITGAETIIDYGIEDEIREIINKILEKKN